MARTLLFLVLLLPGGLSAQEIEPDLATALLEARERLASLGAPADGEPESGEYAGWRQAIEERIDLLEELIRTAQEQEDLEDLSSLEDRTLRADMELEAERQRDAPSPPGLESVDEVAGYEQQFSTAEVAHREAQSRLDSLRASQAQAQEERRRLPGRSSEAQRRLDTTSETDELGFYLAANARLELRVASERGNYLAEALSRWTVLEAALRSERDVAGLRLERSQALLKLAREEAAALREADAQRAREAAEAERQAAEQQRDPVERFRRSAAAEVSRRRADTASIENEIGALKESIDGENAAAQRLIEDRSRLERRLRLHPRGADRYLRRTLDQAAQSRQLLRRQTLPRLYAEMERNQERLVAVLDRFWDLTQSAAENKDLQSLLAEVPEERHQEARRAFDEAVAGRDGLLDALRQQRSVLEGAEGHYAELVSLVEARNQVLVEFIEELRSYLIWIPTESPLGTRAWSGMQSELAALWSHITSTETRAAVGRNWRGRAAPVVLVLTAALGLIVLDWRFRRQASEKGPAETRFQVLLAVLRALLIPAVLFLAAWAANLLGLLRPVGPPLAALLAGVAIALLARQAAILVLRDGGIGRRIFELGEDLAAQLLRAARWVTAAAALFLVPSGVLAAAPYDFVHLVRLLGTGWLVSVALSLALLAWPNGALMKKWTPAGGISRRVVRVGARVFVMAALLEIILILFGFRVLAEHGIANSAKVLGAALVLAGLYTYLDRRTPHIARRIEGRLAPRLGKREASESSLAAAAVLTRVTTILLIAAAALMLQQLWGIGSVLTDALKAARLTEVKSGDWLTLHDVLVALVWIGLGHLLAHNLARVYEAVVVPLAGERSTGSRFAFLTLTRYAVLVLAYGSALLSLKLSLTSIGWLLTAVSVGLGFGLQEIVANFVSGLILLFEQPIRVGDIITIGDTGGTVEKITIRATIVTNWEKQTIIVPNKNFVTQNLTNWTRHDQVMRRTIQVAVAYGSNVEEVLRILDQVVSSHPEVLSEPAHRIWFNGFGEYCLKFEVWFYATIATGLRTKSELNTRIYQRFEEEGIDIPLLKREFLVTSGSESTGPPALTTGASQNTANRTKPSS